MTSPTARSALAIVAAIALVACDPAPPAERDVPGASPRSEIPPGGQATFGVLGEPPTLDPFSPRASDLTYALARPVYRSLARVLPDGTIASDLVNISDAGSIVAVDDGVVVTIEPARWSDGTPVTARDVVRSSRRAIYPSGFVGLEATAVGRRRVRFEGRNFGDWARRLALGTFVLPSRPNLRVGSGPFVVARYVPGLELVYERNRAYDGEAALLDKLTVRFVADLEIMLKLVEQGRLDGAAPPSAINLDERLSEIGLEFSESPGWETVALSFDPARTDRALRAAFVAAIDKAHIAEGLIRDEGRALSAKVPAPHPEVSGVEVQLATASGDELLQLMQRVLQKDLGPDGITGELVQVDPATLYGRWNIEPRTDVALVREIVPGFFGRRVPKDLTWFPLFSVHSFVAWGDGINGLEPNGSLEGPLWNAEEWWLD